MQTEVSLAGLVCLPRQDGNRNGMISDFAVYLSSDPDQRGNLVKQASFLSDGKEQTLRFDRPAKGRYLTIVAKAGFGADTLASLAEIDFLLE